LFKFLQRTLVVNSNGNHKLDGIIAMKILITLMENLPGQIDAALPQFVGMLLAELKNAVEEKAPKNYISMILQAICVSFFNNCAATLQIIESNQQTVAVFSCLMDNMKNFKHEFEIRRIVFGLTCIVRTPAQSLPPIVAQKMQEIMKQLADSAMKVYKIREDTLKENEEHIAKGGPTWDDYDDEDSDENIDADDNVRDEKEFKDTMDKLRAFKDGKPLDDDDDDYDDEDDSDYEVDGGDMGMYDSKLD